MRFLPASLALLVPSYLSPSVVAVVVAAAAVSWCSAVRGGPPFCFLFSVWLWRPLGLGVPLGFWWGAPGPSWVEATRGGGLGALHSLLGCHIGHPFPPTHSSVGGGVGGVGTSQAA